MEVNIGYQELECLLQDFSGKNIHILYKSSQTLNLAWSKIDLNLTVETIEDSGILLSYSGGWVVERLVSPILKLFKGKLGNMLDILPHHQLRFSFDKEPKARNIVQKLALKELYFNEEEIFLEVLPKELVYK